MIVFKYLPFQQDHQELDLPENKKREKHYLYLSKQFKKLTDP